MLLLSSLVLSKYCLPTYLLINETSKFFIGFIFKANDETILGENEMSEFLYDFVLRQRKISS